MMLNAVRKVCPAFVLALLGGGAALAQIAPPVTRLYRPQEDVAYLQEIGSQIASTRPVTAIAVHAGTVYAVCDGKLQRVTAATLEADPRSPSGVERLFVAGDALWCMTSSGVHRLTHQASAKVWDEPMVDMTVHLGQIYGATRRALFRWDGDRFVDIRPADGWLTTDTTVIRADGRQILSHPVEVGPIQRIASYSGTLYVLRPGEIALLDGAIVNADCVDWGALPSPETRDALALGSRLFVATAKGLGVLRGAALTTTDGDDGLPYEDLVCLEAGFDGDVWIGTKIGAIRWREGEFHYFGAHHWLPGDVVHDIAVADHRVYLATDRGIGIISYAPLTLEKKAEYFQKTLGPRGHQRLGFVHQLHYSDAEREWQREISDNDGGFTSHYLAAMCFKYATTQDEDAKREAQDAAEAIFWLRTITGVDGLIARAVWANNVDQGKRAELGSGGLPARWYPTDDGLWTWKGDVSSDEVNAHFYSVALYHDLVAQGEQKKLAAEHLASIAKHIIDQGWLVRDKDGQPTRWGRWDPEYLLQPYGFESRGLNGMEAQTYMWTAARLSGNPVYRQGLDQLLKWRYHTYTVREKMTFPPDSVAPWDDELAFRCFLPLVAYCDDPYLRSIYLRALERHWETMRMQKVPFFNFLYGGLTGNDCDAPQAVRHLREWSLDTVSHAFRNSHRSDLAPEPGYPPYVGQSRALSPRDLGAMWGSRPAIEQDGGGGGRTIVPPIGWLEDYWMGRYFGMIGAGAEEGRSIVVPEIVRADLKASPYAGPARPALASTRAQR